MFELLHSQVLARDRNLSGLIELSRRYLAEERTPDELKSLAGTVLSAGLNTYAAELFKVAYEKNKTDLAPLLGYANSLKDILLQDEALRIYRFLHSCLPDNLVVWRNFLLAMEYSAQTNDEERFEYACKWGRWVEERYLPSQGLERPIDALVSKITRDTSKSLRVGYLSADLCQHTVGLFLRHVLKHHSDRIHAITYNCGSLEDGVTREIAQISEYKKVAGFTDLQLAAQLKSDSLDVLIDLAGHTAGSRLHLLAADLAPLRMSWLGYFATTGLSTIDGVVLDRWHLTEQNHRYFSEPTVSLECGRLCYSPVEFSPSVARPPVITNQFVTFGSFNNTGKYSAEVFSVWAKILNRVENSRLLLKWRTFDDNNFCRVVLNKFSMLGITPDRIELRGFSTHDKMLAEYADIDIALDPFPFSGGLTSCEALWMGVPVVTWPQTRVVSRQTLAFLSAIGMGDCCAQNECDYVEKAVSFAGNKRLLSELRANLRVRMQDSVLMDVQGFVSEFEEMLFQRLAAKMANL